MSETRDIPTRRVVLNDPSQLPHEYSQTPGGTLFSTTPGGNFHFDTELVGIYYVGDIEEEVCLTVMLVERTAMKLYMFVVRCFQSRFSRWRLSHVTCLSGYSAQFVC